MVLFFGVATLAVSAVVLSFSTGYWSLLFGACLAGLGNGVFHPADYTLINRRVSSERVAHAYSMHGVSGALGWAASPAVLVAVTTFAGWRQALLVASGVAFVMLGVLYWRRHVLMGSQEQRDLEETARKNSPAFSFDYLKLPMVWMCWGFFLFECFGFEWCSKFCTHCHAVAV